MSSYNKADRPDVSPDEMYRIASTVLERAFSDPALVKKFMDSALVIRFTYTDTERWGPGEKADITLDFTCEPFRLVLGPCDIKPVVHMTMETFTAHLFWMKKLTLMPAVSRGLIKARGPIPKAMRLLPALKPIYENYRLALEDLGREDLLAFPPD